MAPGPVSVKVAALMVVAFMTSLNVAEIVVLIATAVAPFTGTVEITVGGAAVVNVRTELAASGAPVESFAPVLIVVVYVMLLERAVVGVKVAVVPA